MENKLIFTSGSLCVDAPKNTIGIYGIQNHITNKWYIGQADIGTCTKGVRGRAQQYLLLRCKSQKAIYNTLKMYGLLNFSCYLLEECLSEELNKKETEWIIIKNSLSPNGYNLTTGGGVNKCSDETKKRMSDSRIGIKFSDEHKKRMSEAGTGRVFSDEHKKNLSDSKIGMKFSDEHKKTLSESANKRFSNQEEIEKIRQNRLGKKQSAESKRKTSEAMKKSWKQRKANAKYKVDDSYSKAIITTEEYR